MLRASTTMQGGSIIGVNVVGDGISDRLFFSRGGVTIEDGDLSFEGRYCAIATRACKTDLLLLDGRRLRFGDIELQSDGPAIQISRFADRTQLVCEGTGAIRVIIGDRVTAINVAGKTALELPA